MWSESNDKKMKAFSVSKGFCSSHIAKFGACFNGKKLKLGFPLIISAYIGYVQTREYY